MRQLIAIEIEFRGYHSERGYTVALRCPRLQPRSKRKFIAIDMGMDDSWLQQAIYWLSTQDVYVTSFACMGADKYVALCCFSQCDSIKNALA